MNSLIVIISILIVAISIWLFKIAAGSMSLLKLNTISYVFYFQLVTSGIVGSVLLATGSLDYHEYAQEISDEVKFEAWLWVMYSILMIPFAMIIINRIFKLNAKTEFNLYLKKRLDFQGTELGNKLVLLGMLIFSILTLGYVLINTKEIPLFTLLSGDSEAATIQRVIAKNEFGGIEYIRSFFGLILMPVCAYYSYIAFRKSNKLFSFLMFSGIFLCTALLLTYDIQKAPIAFFILGFWIAEVLVSGGISIKTALFMIAGVMLLILIGYSMTTDKSVGDQFLRLNSAFYGRTFVTGYFAFPLSLELFPDIITIQTYYSGIPSFFQDGTHVEAARALMMYMNPEGVREGTSNLFSGYFMGEAWANYGYIGLIVAPAVVGVIIQLVHVFLLKNTKSPLIIAFYAMVTVRWLVGAGFVNFLFLKLLIFPLILYYLSKFIVDKIKFFKA